MNISNIIRYAVVITMTMLWTACIILGTHAVIYRGPVLLYSVRSPRPKAECARISQGMQFDAAVALITSKTEPFEQTVSFETGHAYFFRASAVCDVEFDVKTLRVVRAVYHEPSIRFDRRSASFLAAPNPNRLDER